MSQLTLISHHLCPYVQRAAIALLEKGVPFERVMIDLDDKPDGFMEISPLGKVPILQVALPEGSEALIFESNVICEYIEETRTEPRLHPAEPLERARHRAWMEFGSAILADIWGLETTSEPGVFDAKRDAITAKFKRVEATLSKGPYFSGKRFSLVDAVFAPICRYFDLFDTITDTGVFASVPKVRAWRAALGARPSVRDAVEPDYGERLLAFLVRHDAHLLKLAA